MGDERQGSAPADDSDAHVQGTGTLTRRLAAGPGLDVIGDGAGPGAGSSHHRTMGVGLREGRARSPDLRADRGFPPGLDEAELKAAVQELPDMAGIELANWNWRVVRQFLLERCSVSLCRSSCLNYLHRLEFAFKRPKKRVLKADETKREAFVAEYAALGDEEGRTGAKIFFADEAHFRADAELRGKWVLKGEPALVDSSSPRQGEKANYYSAVCLEMGRWNGWNWRGTARPAQRPQTVTRPPSGE